jgi:hypothetical protein
VGSRTVGTTVVDTTPDDDAFADQIVHVAKRCTLVEGDLYWRGTNNILM